MALSPARVNAGAATRPTSLSACISFLIFADVNLGFSMVCVGALWITRGNNPRPAPEQARQIL